MISDNSLIKISLTITLIGLIALFLIVHFIGPKEIEIGKINKDMIGQIVLLRANVESYFSNDGHIFIDAKDSTGTIKVVMFENEAKNNPLVYYIEKNNTIEIRGKIQLYKNELEIVATSIKII
ncbi:MAG: OB-fold nucleic acid binding domain-containing protein [Candidatus Aenigmatarchaeota archaeon]